MTAHIVSALALNLNAGDRRSIAAEQTDNLEAYDSFLRGRELWFQTTKDANREAGTLLRRAIELDPRFAPAYAFLGESEFRTVLSAGNVARAKTIACQGHSPRARDCKL